MWGRCGRDHVLSLKYLNNQILLYEKEYKIYFTHSIYVRVHKIILRTLTAAVV